MSLERVVGDEESVRRIGWTIVGRGWALASDPGPVDVGETETRCLTDRPEIPGEEQKNYRKERANSTEWLQASVAEVEAGVTVVLAMEVVTAADCNPEDSREDQGEGRDEIEEGVLDRAPVVAIVPRLRDGGEAGARCSDDRKPREQMTRKCEVVVLADKDERISRDKGHGGEHRGADVEVYRAPVRLIILLDGKIAGEGRPEIGAPKQRDVQQAQGEDQGVENHPDE